MNTKIKTHQPVKASLFTGLSRTLGLSFLLFALLPLTLTSYITLNITQKNTEEEIYRSLRTTAELRTRQIENYFDTMLKQLELQAATADNVMLLENLDESYHDSNKSLKDFVKSFKWMTVVDWLGTDLINYRNFYNYHDIFLINKNGEILFSAAKEKSLGTNILESNDSPKFASSVQKTLDTGEVSFSDYEYHFGSSHHIYGTITAPIIDDMGESIGVIAFQFSIDPITKIMASDETLRKTTATYLVGYPDLTLRSGHRLDKSLKLINKKISTKQTAILKKQIEDGIKIKKMNEKVISYIGPLGVKVLGIHRDFKIKDSVFSVIAEVNEDDAFSSINRLHQIVLMMFTLTFLTILLFAGVLSRRIVNPLLRLVKAAKQIEKGNFSQLDEIDVKNEIGDLMYSFNNMSSTLKTNFDKIAQQSWVETGQTELSIFLRGEHSIKDIAEEVIKFLAKYLDAQVGVFYIAKDNTLYIAGSYAYSTSKNHSKSFAFGEGLVGQVAVEKKINILNDVPNNYLSISSGLGKIDSHSLLMFPLIFEGNVKGVVELGAIKDFTEIDCQFVEQVAEGIAIALHTTETHLEVKALLEKSQAQQEELTAQQEELRASNEELEAQKDDIVQKNIELKKSRAQIEEKAAELEVASKYKSEFLANMSHELRTPLNSILLLSKHLEDNNEENLSEKQIECASIVHSSGNDLLNLINEVLDLAKIESGKMNVDIAEVSIDDMTSTIKRNFQSLAEQKGIQFVVNKSANVPEKIYTDLQKITQILKNLLANAFKFTDKGSVTYDIDFNESDSSISFAVKDTGIGFPEEEIENVFQAFKQADGTTSRKYGGTGLGLSISRELTGLLGGSLIAHSKLNEGSTFALTLPIDLTKDKASVIEKTNTQQDSSIKKDIAVVDNSKKKPYVKEKALEGKKILIVDDDMRNVFSLISILEDRGMSTVAAADGEDALEKLISTPDIDIVLTDIMMPKMDGYEEMKAIRKMNSNLSTIPIIALTAKAMKGDRAKCIEAGASDYLCKPVDVDKLLSILRVWLYQ